MELYKVLKRIDGRLFSPFQRYEYTPGKKMVCLNFDTNEREACSYGYYATDIDGLIYTFRNLPIYEVWKVEVGGKRVEVDQFKRRYEEITLIEHVPNEKVKELAQEWEPKVGYKLAEALFPVHPLLIPRRGAVTAAEFQLLKQWDSIRNSVKDSVRYSVWDSVRYSVWNSVGYSVWDSVRYSVGYSVVDSVGYSVEYSVGDSVVDSVWAYMSSLYPGIEKWKYIDHPKGQNPFQPAIDLWRAGLVPSFDGKLYRLHAGEKAEIVWEGSVND
jgi:hypothetical protein